MTEEALSADTLFEKCTAGDLEGLQELLADPAYVATALRTEDRIRDRDIGHVRALLNVRLMFEKAAAAGSADIVRYLIGFAETHRVPYDELIHRGSINPTITSKNNVAVFKEMVAIRPDAVNQDLGHGFRPLAYAIRIYRCESYFTTNGAPLVHFLLENGANVNYVFSPFYEGPGVHLASASCDGALEIVELLLQHGAKIEQSGAIHGAAQHGRIDVLELLVQHGADINEQLWLNDPGRSARIRAKMKREYGIEMEAATRRGPKSTHDTPMHFSVLHQKHEATVWLLKHGADSDIEDSFGYSAKALAVLMGDEDVLDAVGA